MNDALRQRLLDAFAAESRDHVTAARALLDRSGQRLEDDALREIYRRVHALKGAARAVEFAAVQTVAHELESLLARVDEAPGRWRPSWRRAVLDGLAAVEDTAEAALAGQPAPDVRAALATIAGLLGTAPAAVAPAEPTPERVEPSAPDGPARRNQARVDMALLDELLAATARARAASHRLSRAGNNAADHRAARRLRDDVDAIWQLVREARLVPADSVFAGLGPMVRSLAAERGGDVDFAMAGGSVRADRDVLQTLYEPVIQLLRNAVAHGIELPAQRTQAGKPAQARIVLSFATAGDRLRVVVADDGRGLGPAGGDDNSDAIAQLLRPGVSRQARPDGLAGRGYGLAVVQAAVEQLQGRLKVAARGDLGGAAFTIEAPLVHASIALLAVRIGDSELLLPARSVRRVTRQRTEDLVRVEGRWMLPGDPPLPLVALDDRLGPTAADDDHVRAIVVTAGGQQVAVPVDDVGEVLEGIVQYIDLPAADRLYLGGVLAADGTAQLVLNPDALVGGDLAAVWQRAPQQASRARRQRILVVDDSITTRTLERTILEAQGYDVLLAVDGMEALDLLANHAIDLVVADVQMPRLDGFGLLERIRGNAQLAELPVVLVTSLSSPAERRRGMELGADAYLSKQEFEQDVLLRTLRQFL